MSRILVTGASGYIALHIVDQFLKAGHIVRGSVRDLADIKKVNPLKKLSDNAKFPIELVQAELLDENSWKKAVEGIDIVIHVASPLPLQNPSNEQEIIKPAVQGTLNVLNASLEAKVKRVVVTSSGLTITGYNYSDKTYSEKDWANPDEMQMAYGKSKVYAEKAIWEFVERKKKINEPCFEVAVIQPVLVLGPMLSPVIGSSANRFLNIFLNKVEKIPNMGFMTCDVRDVAAAHVKAAFLPEAAGHRHIIVSEPNIITMSRWSEILVSEFEPKGFKIPKEVENGTLNGKNAKVDDTRMRKVLGITPHDFKSTIIDMAYSVMEQNLHQ